MKQNRRALALVAFTAAALVLTSCSQGGDKPTSTEPGEPVEVTFQSFSDQPAAIEATKEIVAAWNKDNPDIQIKIVQAPTDGLDDKLTTQFAGGVAPDIVHYEIQGIVPFAMDGYLSDLSKLLSEETLADIDPGVLESVTINDEVVGAPTELQTYVVFANKKLLDDAGVKVPTGDSMTWDELAEIAKATTAGDVHGMTWGLKSPTAAFMSLGMGFGAKFFEGTGDDAAVAIGDAEFEVPNRVKAMIDAGSIDPIGVTQSGSEVLATFYGGKAAMTVQGSYQIANIAKDAPANMDWIVLPPLAGSEGASQAASPQTLSINIDSKYQEQAAKFIDFFMTTDNLVKMNIADGLIPTTISAREALATETADQNGWPEVIKSGEGLRGPAFLSANGYVRWKDTVATPTFQKFLGGEMDESAAGKALEDGWQ